MRNHLSPKRITTLAFWISTIKWQQKAIAIIAFVALDSVASAQVSYVDTIIPEPAPYTAGIEYPQQPTTEEILERLKAAEAKIAELSEEGANAKDEKPEDKKEEKKEEKKKGWFEKYKFSGYTQLRINETLEEEPGGALAQHVGDSSVGRNNEFLIRRARLTFEGDVTDRIYVYLQPDFASSVPGSSDSNQFAQIRDWYADLYLDECKEYRVRVGQSKIPYGWENLQSSRNRLPLDRNDAFNSGAKNERDLGAFFYWTPQYAQDFFETAIDENLKGSGNYGVFGFGVYNGQGGSLREQNDNLHVISRLALPYTFNNGQMMEVGIQGYYGKYTVLSTPISPLGVGPTSRPLGTLERGNVPGILDERIGTTLVYYPQPLGFQTEWTVGRGPGLNDAQTEVVDRPLYGGYAMVMRRYETDCYGEIWPFFRWSFYNGGYKSELNAPFSEISELELGCEWQMTKYVELVSMYTWTERTNTRGINAANQLSYQQFDGDLLRFQLQVRY
jgi:hypothetical protein